MDKQEAKHINMPSPSACEHKSVEAYLFIDPLCKDCWEIEPFIIKLWLEYGKYFSIRHIVTGKWMERTLPHTNGINLLIFDLCGKRQPVYKVFHVMERYICKKHRQHHI